MYKNWSLLWLTPETRNIIRVLCKPYFDLFIGRPSLYKYSRLRIFIEQENCVKACIPDTRVFLSVLFLFSCSIVLMVFSCLFLGRCLVVVSHKYRLDLAYWISSSLSHNHHHHPHHYYKMGNVIHGYRYNICLPLPSGIESSFFFLFFTRKKWEKKTQERDCVYTGKSSLMMMTRQTTRQHPILSPLWPP